MVGDEAATQIGQACFLAKYAEVGVSDDGAKAVPCVVVQNQLLGVESPAALR